MNLAELKNQITTGNELNRIVNQWKRFSEKNRPGSTKPVEHNGKIVPAQMVKEQRYKVIRENKARKALLYDIHPSYDDYKPWEQATALSNKNLAPVKLSPQNNALLSDIWSYFVTDNDYAYKYSDTLRNVHGSDDYMTKIADAIERLADDDPIRMRKILENSKYDQVLNIDFIYKPEDSADKTPWEDYKENGSTYDGKRTQLIRFWERELSDYL